MIVGIPKQRFFQRLFLLIGWATLILLLSFVAQAERLPFKIFTTENGLPQNITNRVMRDSRGFLWFSTEDGLSRFDGQIFVNYGSSNGLPHPQINHILEARDGSYWVATYGGGVVRLDVMPNLLNPASGGSMFTLIPTIDLPEEMDEANRAIYLFQDRTNTIWYGAFNGLFRLENEEGKSVFRRVNLLSGNTPFIIRGMTEDTYGNLWLWSRNGVLRRQPDGRTTHYAIRPGDNYDPVQQIFFDQKGKIWIAHEESGLIVLDENRVAQITNSASKESFTIDELKPAITGWFGKNKELADDRIYSLFQSSDNDLWIGTASGITKFDGKNFQNYTAADGLPETPYNWLAEDASGNIWATTNQGAVKLTRHGFITYQQAEGIGVRGVRSIWESAEGELRVITPDSKFHQRETKKFVSAAPLFPDGTAFQFPQNVIEDSAGEMWAATRKGLFRFPKNDFLALSGVAPQKFIGLPSDFVMTVYEDSRDNIWISLANGRQRLARLERNTGALEFFDEMNAAIPPGFVAAAFVEDAAGVLWIGNFGGGLLRYRNGKFDYFPTAANGAAFGQAQILFADTRGILWMGTKGGGVWKITEIDHATPKFSQLTTKNGISSDNVTSVTEDEWGRIYIGTGRGIDWLNPHSENIGHYSTVDGLNDNKIEISFRDRRGALWFGTANSLARFIPPPPQPSVAPPVFITGLHIAGKDLPLSTLGQTEVGEISVDSGQNQVVIEFAGIDFATGQPLRFQYKLTGAQDDWSQPNVLRSVNFVNLAPGEYQFLVQAITIDGVSSLKPASVSLKILSPIYLRWWFLLAFGLLSAGLIYLVYNFRVSQLLKIEHARTMIATDLHDDIGANLSKISVLSEVVRMQMANNNESSNKLLNSIAEISRDSVSSMSDIVWAINPKRDSLLEMMRKMREHAEEILVPKNIVVRFVEPETSSKIKLAMNLRRDLYLIFKEAINNVAKHSNCTSVKIDFQIKRHEIILRIEDDGRGFDPKLQNNGNGLSNMQARVDKLKGKLEIESIINRGTTLLIHIPPK